MILLDEHATTPGADLGRTAHHTHMGTGVGDESRASTLVIDFRIRALSSVG